jgi:hypothetical protein
MSWKKIILITIIAIIVVVAGYFLWISVTSPVTEPAATMENAGGALPDAGVTEQTDLSPATTTPQTNPTEVSITKVSHGSALAFWVANGRVYYVSSDGTVSIAGEKEDTQISTQKMTGIRDIQINPWDSSVLAAFGPIGAASWGVFDTNDRTWRPLSGDVVAATWGTKSGEIVATVKTNGGGQNLISLDTAKPSSYKIILKNFSFSGVSFVVKLPQTLIIFERPSGLSVSRAWALDLKKLSFSQVAAAEAGLDVELSLDKKSIFQFSAAEQKVYITSDSIKNHIETLPGKCFSGSTSTETYCFAPRGTVDSSFTLPDDYLQEKFFTNDGLYRITSSSIEVASIPLASQLDAHNPIYASDAIFFINRPDGAVYKISPASGIGREVIGS